MSERMDRMENRLAESFFGDNNRRKKTFQQTKEPIGAEEIVINIDGEEFPFFLGEESGC